MMLFFYPAIAIGIEANNYILRVRLTFDNDKLKRLESTRRILEETRMGELERFASEAEIDQKIREFDKKGKNLRLRILTESSSIRDKSIPKSIYTIKVFIYMHEQGNEQFFKNFGIIMISEDGEYRLGKFNLSKDIVGYADFNDIDVTKRYRFKIIQLSNLRDVIMGYYMNAACI